MKISQMTKRLLVGLLFLSILATQVVASKPQGGLAEADSPDEIQEYPGAFPKTPPDARKISVGDPDDAGYAQVSGAAGAVPSEARVIIVNLSAHNLITTTAGTQGGFAASLFAPPGSSLLVKYETNGVRIKSFWNDAVNGVAGGTAENLNELPGTVLYVGGPEPVEGEGQTFHTVGAISPQEPPKDWAGWWMEGKLTVQNPQDGWRLTVIPGETVDLALTVYATSPALNCVDPQAYPLTIRPELREMFGTGGTAKAWEVWFDASLFTPTGLPVEHEGGVPAVPLGAEDIEFQHLSCLNSKVLTGDLETTLTIPADLPEGYYRPSFFFHPQIDPSDQVPQAVVWLHDGGRAEGLPILKVGDPAPPRVPWLLFGDELVNGQRGVTAYQDRGRFEMVNRVTIPPHLSVIPRIDDRSGGAIVYNLAPGASWLSNTDRRLAPPPHIPFQYPSGQMSADIHWPDGNTVEHVGPAPLQGSSVRTPTTPGGAEYSVGTGHLADIYHLYNFGEAFEYSFQQEGIHLIELHGTVYDVFGNPYSLESTYEFMVAHVLDIDPNILPTTPFTVDDFFSAGLHLYPPVPAHVLIEITHMPESDPTQAVMTEVSGQANPFGYFHTEPGFSIPMDSPGEYRVDIRAEHHTQSGEVWFGTMTWGSVVASSSPPIKAHGRRGMDYHSSEIQGPRTWFRNQDLPPEEIGIENYYPYHSGDIHWGHQVPAGIYGGDSIHTILTFEDLSGGTFYDLVEAQYPKATNPFRWPPDDGELSLDLLQQRLKIGEAPLLITTYNGKHPELYPEDIDVLGYWYGSSQRPDVRVRELISEDNMGTAYWRFDDTYNYQIGEPADGDQPGDIKWEFGGLVLRTITETNPINQYAIYSSLWVLLPDTCDAYGCARVTAPFRVIGGTIDGGPIMTLLGEEINNLFLPKCVRPGDVLEIGNTIALCGHVGPPLDSRVDLTITSPSGVTYDESWHANQIGWLYDPTFDFPADEAGRWKVDISVAYDKGYLPYGLPVSGNNTGTVLGTQGQYEFYVVDPGSDSLLISSPKPGYITWSSSEIDPVPIWGLAPPGSTAVYYTIHDKGVVMGQGELVPGSDGDFMLTYDPVTLHQDFPMLSLTAHEGRWQGLADEVNITFLAVGSGPPKAGAVTLIGEQVFVRNPAQLIMLPVVVR